MNHKKILKLFVISMMFLGVFGFLFIEKTNAQVGGNFWKLVSSLLQPNVSTWSIYAPSNLRFDGEIQPDGSTCANGEILKKTATNDWDCASDTGGTFPFTADTYGGQVVNATSTGLFLKGTPLGLVASTTFATRATTTSATTTNFAVSSLTSALLLTDANGSLDEYAGTTCTNQFVRVLSVLGVATCATVGTADVAGLDVSDDTNLAVTSPITLTGDTVGFDFSTSNTWTGANIFNNITRSTTTSATSTNFFSTTASTTNLAIGGGTLRIFGTVGTALSDFCTAITGGAGLCDGSDDGGAGTSAFEIATTTDIAVSGLSYFTNTSGRTTLGSVATTTLAGTSNQISVSNSPKVIGASGAVLSFPNTVIFPQYASTTLGFSTAYASSTLYHGAGLASCDTTTGKLLWTNGVFSCGTDFNTGGGGSDPFTHPSAGIFATTTNFIIGSSATASSTLIGNLNITGNSTTTQATTTNFFSTTLTATTGFFTNLWIGVDTLAEYISDTAGAMWTGNTETGGAITYQDADNTIDFVCNTATSGVFGCLDSADWSIFNNKVSSTSIDVSSELIALVTDEVGTGFLTFNAAPNFTGDVGFATTTGTWPLTSFSSTEPQFSLSAGAGFAQWAFRNAGGNLYFSTTTVAGTATSTPAALELRNSGTGLGIATSTFSSAVIGLGTTGSTNGTSTVAAGKLQFDGYNTAGSRICMFVVSTTLTIQSGACNQ